MRLFIALPLLEETRLALEKVLEQLQRASSEVRWVRPENIHLTLRFLGETDASQVAALSRSIDQISAPRPAVDLRLDRLGGFPNLRKPRVFWIGTTDLQATGSLVDLAQQIEMAVRPLGFDAETKPFKPHLTLGRLKQAGNPERLVRIVQDPRLPELRAHLDRIALIQSTLTPRGSIYETLHEAPLAGGRRAAD
jgi:2'-5' RNA ligase